MGGLGLGLRLGRWLRRVGRGDGMDTTLSSSPLVPSPFSYVFLTP